ncbi:LPP20 family lipoprotein [Parabacteroides sp.]
MRQIILILLNVMVGITIGWAQTPDWLQERPMGAFDYIGIGSASKDTPDYQQVAKRNALAELTSEIEVLVEANSLLTLLEKDNAQSSSSFTQMIQTTAHQQIQDYEVAGTYDDGERYWVYCRLDKETYATQRQLRREQAIKKGFDFWYQGQTALQEGYLISAIDFFIQGLNAIEPCANEDLSCSYNGQTLLLGNALYTSLKTVFNDIQITSSPSEVELSAFQTGQAAITLTVTKSGIPLRNVQISGAFISGSGALSAIPATDAQGMTTSYIQNVTSKGNNQQVQFALDLAPFQKINSPLFTSLREQVERQVPHCLVMVGTQKSQNLRAYVQTEQQGNEGIIRGIRSMIANKYFDLTDSPNTADVIIQINSEFIQGNLVEGDMFNMREYFTTVSIQLKNNRSGAILLNYVLDKRRTLAPVNQSAANARGAAIREVMKVINRELPKQLEQLNIDTEGDIPQVIEQRQAPRQPVSTQPVVVVQPQPQAGPSITPSTQPETPPQTPPSAELEQNVIIRYKGKRDMGERTFLRFEVINKNEKDYVLSVFLSDIVIVNAQGEELKTANIKIGAKYGSYHVSSLIVPDTPTLLEVEINRTNKIALFQLTNDSHRTIKIRNL